MLDQLLIILVMRVTQKLIKDFESVQPTQSQKVVDFIRFQTEEKTSQSFGS